MKRLKTLIQKSDSTKVALGILLSRCLGLVRERVIAYYFGNGMVSDALRAAQRIPNFLQNLFGEGVLSASFIPVYSKLLAQERSQEARSLANSIFALLVLLVSFIVTVGIWVAPLLVSIITPGFSGEQREITIKLVRIIFPGTGVLVFSAWCLGILNSHHRFLLSYTAPLAWNATIILTLLFLGDLKEPTETAYLAGYGIAIGGALQFLVQLPSVLRLIEQLRPKVIWEPELKKVITNFFPVVLGRGATQISAYVDSIIASLLPVGAVASLAYTQTIYLIPISLFGMSISAAKLPKMSSHLGEKSQVAEQTKGDLERALAKISQFVLPISLGFIIFPELIVAAFYQTGRFGSSDVKLVGQVLAGSSLGLLAASLGRMMTTGFYSLGDTKTPFRVATTRVIIGSFFSYVSALWLPSWLDLPERYGIVFLACSFGLISWLELVLLVHLMNQKLGSFRTKRISWSWNFLIKVTSLSSVSLLLIAGLVICFEGQHPIGKALLSLGPGVALYALLTRVFLYHRES